MKQRKDGIMENRDMIGYECSLLLNVYLLCLWQRKPNMIPFFGFGLLCLIKLDPKSLARFLCLTSLDKSMFGVVPRENLGLFHHYPTHIFYKKKKKQRIYTKTDRRRQEGTAIFQNFLKNYMYIYKIISYSLCKF